MAYGPRAKYFPVRPDLTQSMSVLSYDHLAFPFFLGGGEIKFAIGMFTTSLILAEKLGFK